MRSISRDIKVPPVNPRRRRSTTHLSVSGLALRYLAGICICAFSLLIPIVVPLVYVGVGIWLSRWLGRHARWALLHNNVNAISHAKLRFIGLWPGEALRLIWQLFVIKAL